MLSGKNALGMLLWFLCWGGFLGMDSAQAFDEYQKKADYLLMVSDYVDWPRSPSLVFCVIGPDPLGSRLNRAMTKNKRADGRKLVSKNISSNPGGHGCNVLFVSNRLSQGAIAGILRGTGNGILTVSDAREFARRGGMIEFMYNSVNHDIRFAINQTAARKAGITLGSQLLRLARELY